MLYLLGLSYGAVSLALDGLGISLCKSRVYDAVQEASKRAPGLKRDQVFAGVQTPALGADLTSVTRPRGLVSAGHHGRSDQWASPDHRCALGRR